MDRAGEINDITEDPREVDKPPVLKILVEKQADIEQTVSLLKKGIAGLAPQVGLKTEMGSLNKADNQKPTEVEFNGLSNLLADSNVTAIIKSVAGPDTHCIINEALGAIKSGQSIEDKNNAFSSGIKKLHSNLSRSFESPSKKDATFNLAMSLVGLSGAKLAR